MDKERRTNRQEPPTSSQQNEREQAELEFEKRYLEEYIPREDMPAPPGEKGNPEERFIEAYLEEYQEREFRPPQRPERTPEDAFQSSYLEETNIPETEIPQRPEHTPEEEFDRRYLSQYHEGASFGPEARERQQKHVSYDFRGGLNTDTALDHITPTELRQADNVVLTERGCISKRKGIYEYYSLPTGNRVTQMIPWPLDNNKFFFVTVYGGIPKLCLQRGDNHKELQNINRGYVGSFFSQNKMYFIDGQEFYEYDDQTESVSVVTSHIPNVPGATNVWVHYSGASHTTTPGIYKCIVVYENEAGALSAPKEFEVEVEPDGEGPRFYYNLANNTGEEMKAHCYRSMADGDICYKVTTQTFTESIVFVESISIADQLLSEREEYQPPPIYTLDIIRRCKYAVRHPKSYRVFYAGDEQDPSALYYSEPNAPDYMLETARIYPPTGDGAVKGLKVFMDAILVFYSHSIWAWKGIDPELDASWEKLPTSEGTVSDRTIQLSADSLTMLGHGGIYAMNPNIIGQAFKFEAGESLIKNIAKDKVTAELRRITNPENTLSIWDGKNQRYMLAYCDDKTGRNNKILVFDWALGAFTRFTKIETDAFMYLPNGHVFISSGNKIGLMKEGERDWGKYYRFRIRTGRFSLNAPFHNKKIDRIYVALQNPQEIGYEMYVYLIVDDTLAEQKTIRLDPGPSSFIARINTHSIGARAEVIIDDGEEVPSGIPEDFKGLATISGGGGVTVIDGEATAFDSAITLSGGGGVEIVDGEAGVGTIDVEISGGGSVAVYDEANIPEPKEATATASISGGGGVEIVDGVVLNVTATASISGGGGVEIVDGVGVLGLAEVGVSGGGGVAVEGIKVTWGYGINPPKPQL